MVESLNANAGAVTALVTLALLLVTGFYAWTTFDLLKEARQSRLQASEPRVVAYFRVNEVHSNIVQMHIANLSGAAATDVTAAIEKITSWPSRFSLENSKILRDLRFMRPHEVLKFDVGMGDELFEDGVPAEFQATISYSSLDGRSFVFSDRLRVESVDGFSHFRIYSMDDVARRLQEISDAFRGVIASGRIRAETYDTEDRDNEREAWRKRREEMTQRQDGKGVPSADDGA